MPEPQDFLPAKPPYLPVPQGLIDYLMRTVEPMAIRVPRGRVTHWKFGEGVIIGYRFSGGRWLVDIKFDKPEYGTKAFLAEVPYMSKEDIYKLTLAEERKVA